MRGRWVGVWIALLCAAEARAQCGAMPWSSGARSVESVSACARDGGAWVAWVESGADSSVLWLQEVDTLGVAVGEPREWVARARPATIGAPSVAARGGSVCVAAECVTDANAVLMLWVQDGNGVPSAHALAETNAWRLPALPRVAWLPDAPPNEDALAVLWTDWNDDTPAIAGAWCAASGEPRAAAAQWTAREEASRTPTLVPWRGDSLAVAWISGEWPSRVLAGYLARGAGALVPGCELSEGDRMARRSAPALAALDDGVVCAWAEGRDGLTRIVSRRWGTEGGLGTARLLDPVDFEHQLSPRLTRVGTSVLCVWGSEDGGEPAVRARWLDDTGDGLGGVVTLAAKGAQSGESAAMGTRAALAVWTSRDSALEERWQIAGSRVCIPDTPKEPALLRADAVAHVTGLRTVWRKGARYAVWEGGSPAVLRWVDVRGRAVGAAVRLAESPEVVPAPSWHLGEMPHSALFPVLHSP